jgi:hypothetical protein
MKSFIDLAISETNQGYSNSRVPITLSLHCIVDSAIQDMTSLATLIADFRASASKKMYSQLWENIVIVSYYLMFFFEEFYSYTH